MNHRRRLSTYRSFSMETLERRSMLAADSAEGSFAMEATDLSDEVSQDEVFQDEVFQDEMFQKSPSDVCSLPYQTSEDSPLPFEAVPIDDKANSVPVSGEAEPVTEPEEPFIGMDSGMEHGQALEMSFNLLVCPPVFEFKATGLIAVQPEVSVDPVLALDITTGVSSLQFIYGDIFGDLTLVERGLHLTSETVDLSTNPGLDADSIMLVYDEPILWCGVGVQTDSGGADNLAAPVESPATASTCDDEAPVVASSSGRSSPSTATSAATAQAFAAFAASIGQGASFGQGTSSGQGGSDLQSVPIVRVNRAVRR